MSVSLFLLVTPCSQAQDVSAAEEAALRALHEKTLRTHKLPSGGPDLLRFFRERTLAPKDIERVLALIEDLKSPLYATRVRADAELNKVAAVMRPVLEDELRKGKHPLETGRRLEVLLKRHPEGLEPMLAEATASLIARDKPAGAAKALLDYVPFAHNPQVVTALREALPALALEEGRPIPVLQAALADALPLKRALAGEALIRAGGAAFKPLVAALLRDDQVDVRWQVTRALVEAADKEAVPLVIDLLDDLKEDALWLAEDLLCRVASDKGPPISINHKDRPEKAQAAWRDWWSKHHAAVDLATLRTDPPMLGNTLVTQMVPGGGLNGKVMEVRPDKEVLWEIGGLRYPVDARVIGRDRVLIAEYFGKRVTERDFKGNILWEKPVDMPVACQRLATGETFIATRQKLILLDRDGNATYDQPFITGSICAAQRLRNGHMLVVVSTGMLSHLDATGRELNTFRVGQIYPLGGNIDVSPGNRILVPAYRDNRVVEYNLDGKEVWSVDIKSPVSASRLPNGNVLVIAMGQTRVMEIDRHGKEVWALDLDGRPWRARKR